MTIRRGEEWGERVATPADLPVLRSDVAVHDWVVGHLASGIPVRPFGLGGGDLARTVGGGSAEQFRGSSTRLTLDAVHIAAGDLSTWSVAHVVARRSWWRGRVWLAMTAEFLDGYDVTPRGHPNDGKVDILDVDPSMPGRARLQARGRARNGSHLPHPLLRSTQVGETVVVFDRPLVVWVDGVRWTTASELRLDVVPDAYVAYV